MTLVGRGQESAALDGILSLARREGQALVLRGEPGVGKSALLDYARERAKRLTVLDARGLETESELPYASLSQLLAPVADDVKGLPPPQRRALRAALGLAPDDRPGDRFAAYVAVSAFLAQAGERRPVLAVVDDGHWLDAGSADALVFVARRAAQSRLALMVALRDGIPSPFDAAGLPEMRVGGIAPDATVEMLGRRDGREVSPEVAARLHEETRGNPLALLELARTLSPGALAGREALPEPLPAGPDVERAFGYRLDQLPQATQAALLVAAADDSGSLEALTKALALQGHELSVLEPAESESLVTVGPTGVEFAHPLVRSVAYQRHPAPARRSAHSALAEALYPHRQLARRAWHLAAATIEPDEEVARELEVAAMEASRRAAPATAARGLEAAARVTPGREDRARRLLEAARCHQITSAVEPGLKALEEAIEATEDPKTRAEAMHLRAQTEGLRSHPGSTGAILIAEAARVEPVDRFRAAAMLLEASIAATVVGQVREALRLANLAQPVAEEAGGELALWAGLQVAAGRILCGDAVGGYPLVQQARPLVEKGHLTALGNVGALIPQLKMFMGHFEEARALFTELSARVRASGTLTALPFPLIGMAETARVMGDWGIAHEHAAEAVTLAAEIGHQPLVACGSLVLASLAGNQGRLEEARGLVDLAITPARQLGIGSVVTLAGWNHGQVELAFGCYDQAIAALEEAGRSAVEYGMEEPGVAAWRQELAEAYARTGRTADAEGGAGHPRASGRSHRPAAGARWRRALPWTAGQRRRLRAAFPPRAAVA